MEKERKERLLKETLVMLSADLFGIVYEHSECSSDACDTMICYAEQFEKELDWQDYDERDYIEELGKFERKIIDELSK